MSGPQTTPKRKMSPWWYIPIFAAISAAIVLQILLKRYGLHFDPLLGGVRVLAGAIAGAVLGTIVAFVQSRQNKSN